MCAYKWNPVNTFKLKKRSMWQSGLAKYLPVEYRKFYNEWKHRRPSVVHWVEKEGRFERNEETGEVRPIQNIDFPLKYPKELNEGIWGGEAVIQGFVKKSKYRRRVPKFWVPNIKKSIVYSEVLNKYMRTIITDRTIHLINDHYGFDHYLLKTRACDLRSELALTIKRNILLALADKTLYPDDPVKREEVYNKYKQYLQAYTREEIEWYGLNFKDACFKIAQAQAKVKQVEPLKLKYRSELIAKLKDAKINEAENVDMPDRERSWVTKINPFSKSAKAE